MNRGYSLATCDSRLGESRTTDDSVAACRQAQHVRAVIKSRRLREATFGEGLFADPAWDMLLHLYATYLERRRVSISSLQIASTSPSTTALRWIARLEERQLIMRCPDQLDARRIFIELSSQGLRLMDQYFAKLVLGESFALEASS